MTLDFRDLQMACDGLEQSVEKLQPTATKAEKVLASEIDAVGDLISEDIALPELRIDAGNFAGVQAVKGELELLSRLPDILEESKDEMTKKVAEFEAQVAEISEFTDACSSALEARQEAFEEITTQADEFMDHAREQAQNFIDSASVALTEAFEEGLVEAGEELFEKMESELNDLFDDAIDVASSGADLVSDAGDSVKSEFEEKAQQLLDDVLEAGVRRIVEVVIGEALKDLAESSAVAAASENINSMIAASAPQLAGGLKAFRVVKRALELAKM